MNIRIEAAQGGEIHLSPVLPSSRNQLRIPDSICYGAVGPFGHVLLQQLDGEDISIHYNTLYFHEGEQIIYRSEEPAICLQIILNNSYYFDSRHLGKGVLHERGMSFSYTPEIYTTFRCRPNEHYTHLTVYYQKKHLLSFVGSIPGLLPFMAKVSVGQAARLGEYYMTADTNILSVIDNILECTYQGHIRELYVGHLCTELLLLSLVRMVGNSASASGMISEDDTMHVYKAKEVILQDMGHHISLTSLAEYMGLSVYKLNHGFKSIYGIGVTEFLLEARMKRAHQVLSETEMPIGVVARESGYSHPHAFSLAFKKYFGYTPAFVQRSGRVNGNHW
ncbi:MAG: helix-turn-helix transcriptional regulator [Chitinophagaceae bacterium]|nr:helix-turn-helix transcriptional regulator [Chitinophagaceae bacterium]